MAKSKAKQKAPKGKPAKREDTCAMQVEPLAGSAPPRNMLRCSRHGQIPYVPQPLVNGAGVNILDTGGVFPAGGVGFSLMRRYFQEHLAGKR